MMGREDKAMAGKHNGSKDKDMAGKCVGSGVKAVTGNIMCREDRDSDR